MNNPFSLIFDKNPKLLIDSPFEKNEIIESFSSETINQQIYLITAIRGSGKTVLMTEISEYFKNKNNWLVVELNPEIDMRSSLLSKLNSIAGAMIKNININLSLFNIFTIGANLENKVTDIETAICKVLEHLKKRNIRVLITIDEVVKNKNTKIFSSMFQILVRNDLPVFLLMTGLYDNIKNLQDEKTLTFLYRASRINLEPLNLNLIALKYQEVFNLSEAEAKKMAKLSGGYAFGFQALGYLTVKHNGDYKKAINEYKIYLEEYSYDKIWSELSENDKNLIISIAKTKSKLVKDIMAYCNLDNNHFNPYRKRLINKGIVDGSHRGKLTFILPLFEEYVLKNS